MPYPSSLSKLRRAALAGIGVIAALDGAAAAHTRAKCSRGAVALIREHYTKFEYRIPARDGVRLFVSVYVPKDVFSDARTYPVMMTRTPYSVAPYGEDLYRPNLGPSELFSKEKFIFVYADVRGRYMSEGEPTQLKPHLANKPGPKDTDESTDTYDTIEWLIHHVPGCEPKVGMWGISQPGFYASAGMIDAHPALLAVSPQAPVTDYYLGDDDYHNGAFMLAANFGFYQNFRPRAGEPAPPPANPSPRFRHDRRIPVLSRHGLARQRRREVLQTLQPLLDGGHRKHDLQHLLAIAFYLEAPEEHQARGYDGGGLVRRGRSAGSLAYI